MAECFPALRFSMQGQTVAAQKQTDQVTIMNSKNEAVTLNFDIKSHLPVKKSFTWRDPTDRERNVEEEIYDNYRLIQGVMTPFDSPAPTTATWLHRSFSPSLPTIRTLTPACLTLRPPPANANNAFAPIALLLRFMFCVPDCCPVQSTIKLLLINS